MMCEYYIMLQTNKKPQINEQCCLFTAFVVFAMQKSSVLCVMTTMSFLTLDLSPEFCAASLSYSHASSSLLRVSFLVALFLCSYASLQMPLTKFCLLHLSISILLEKINYVHMIPVIYHQVICQIYLDPCDGDMISALHSHSCLVIALQSRYSPVELDSTVKE